VDEFQLIRRYFERSSSDDAVIEGIGDDGAVLRPAPGRDLLTVVDTLISEVHFPRSLPAEDVGYRCVAVNISDIAAMGGRPRWMTLAITRPDADSAWLDSFARGLFLAADDNQVELVGGDTTAGRDTVISIQVIGDVMPGTAMTRSGAEVGDKIYVTGFVGDAAAGLSCLQSSGPETEDARYLVRRFCRPESRVSFGQMIAPNATACIDLSDGLFADCEKLLAASNVSGVINLNAVPLSPQIRNQLPFDEALQLALGGGDDYELCFTSSGSETDLQAIAKECDVLLSAVGEVLPGSDLSCTKDGLGYDYHHEGYRHFR
jgi:thiamine-monophosphate kinase